MLLLSEGRRKVSFKVEEKLPRGESIPVPRTRATGNPDPQPHTRTFSAEAETNKVNKNLSKNTTPKIGELQGKGVFISVLMYVRPRTYREKAEREHRLHQKRLCAGHMGRWGLA